MFNGACYILLDAHAFDGWHSYNPTLAKGKARKLIKEGVLVYAGEAKYKNSSRKYALYKFDTKGREQEIY